LITYTNLFQQVVCIVSSLCSSSLTLIIVRRHLLSFHTQPRQPSSQSLIIRLFDRFLAGRNLQSECSAVHNTVFLTIYIPLHNSPFETRNPLHATKSQRIPNTQELLLSSGSYNKLNNARPTLQPSRIIRRHGR